MSYDLFPVSVKNEGRTRFLVWCEGQSGDYYLRDGDNLIVGDSLDALRNALAEKSREVDWGSLCLIDIDQLFSDFEAISIEHTSDDDQNSLFLPIIGYVDTFCRVSK